MELDITKIVEEIAMQAKENQEEFIFETIQPYCEDILQMKINKEELKQILLNGTQKQQPCEDCISREEALRHRHIIYDDDGVGYSVVRVDEIEQLPSVTPQPCEEENPTCTECRYYDKEKHHCPRFCRVIENTMAEITSEQTRWIPVSERLPEENIHVLCQFYMGGMAECYHAHDYWHIVGGFRIKIDDVLAWMPLPQPYVESEDKE